MNAEPQRLLSKAGLLYDDDGVISRAAPGRAEAKAVARALAR